MEGHDHMAHGMPARGPMCNMNARSLLALLIQFCQTLLTCHRQMLFTWDTTNLCIIFRGWHVYSTLGLILSLFGVVILTAGYELVREVSRRYEIYSAESASKVPSM